MAQAQHYVTHYRQMEIKSADQFELVLLLYKGAIKHLNLAKRHVRDARIEQRVNSINQATAIIGELQTALDFEKGGEIAASLNRLYTYTLGRLAVANAKQDVALIEEVIRLLATLQSAWEQARIEYNSSQTSPHLRPLNQAARSPQLVAR